MGDLSIKKPYHDTILQCIHWEWIKSLWNASTEPGESHIAYAEMEVKPVLCGYSLLILKSFIRTKQIGPAHAAVKICLKLFNVNVHVINYVINIGPLKQRLIHHFYTESNTLLEQILARFIGYSLRKMVFIFHEF